MPVGVWMVLKDRFWAGAMFSNVRSLFVACKSRKGTDLGCLTSLRIQSIIYTENRAATNILLTSEMAMRSGIIQATALMSALAMLPAAVPAATTQDNFLLRTAGDLAAVCSPAPNDPVMAA